MPKLQFGDDAYRIVGDTGEGGELVEYGLAATLQAGMHRYVAVVGKEGEDVVSLLPNGEWLIDGAAVQGVEQEDVVFKGPNGETEAVEEEEEVTTAQVDDEDGDEDGDEDADDDEDDEDEDLNDDGWEDGEDEEDGEDGESR